MNKEKEKLRNSLQALSLCTDDMLEALTQEEPDEFDTLTVSLCEFVLDIMKARFGRGVGYNDIDAWLGVVSND